MRSAIIAVSMGVALTLVSSGLPGRARAAYSEIMGCETGCEVAAAGWPAPYLVDYPGISVVGSADLSGALLGEDKFRPLPFGLCFLFWTAVSAGLGFVASRRISR